MAFIYATAFERGLPMYVSAAFGVLTLLLVFLPSLQYAEWVQMSPISSCPVCWPVWVQILGSSLGFVLWLACVSMNPTEFGIAKWDPITPLLFITRYVSAQLSISSNLQCLNNSSCSFTINAVAYIVCVKQFVVSIPALSLGDWFSVSRKGGTGGGAVLYTPKGWKQHGYVWVWL